MNEKLTAILVDDEPFCTQGLAIELKNNCPNIDVIATCNSAKEGLQKIKKMKPDVVFLDIEMPWMNGFELIELLAPVNFQVIFVTAFDKFALQAFKISAIDYLMKPIISEDLIRAVSRLDGIRNNKDAKHQKLEHLIAHMKNPYQTIPKLSVPSSDGIDLIPIHSIIYCRADDCYTEIVTMSGKKLLISKVLKKIVEQLSDFDFFRVHQSYLINMDHLSKFSREDGGQVLMSNGETIAVSRSNRTILMHRLRM